MQVSAEELLLSPHQEDLDIEDWSKACPKDLSTHVVYKEDVYACEIIQICEEAVDCAATVDYVRQLVRGKSAKVVTLRNLLKRTRKVCDRRSHFKHVTVS